MTKHAAQSDEKAPRSSLSEGQMHWLLGYRLAQAAIVATRAFESEVGKPMGLRPVEFTILQLLSENALASPTKLAHALDITLPGVKMWIDRLEKRDWLRRTTRDTDRRSHTLELTDEGRQVVDEALVKLLSADTEIFHGLKPSESRVLLELLAKVAKAKPGAGHTA